ncbi:MAG: hypothetical protein N3G21_10920 [Candidatus Hydrogenedentes bacterium]|nr:hypothetical protein [Candidatus Hydrogenedentota bacterium]
MSKLKLIEIVETVDGELLAGENIENCFIGKIYAGDRISDLIVNASGETLIVTHINNISLLQLLELFDIPAVCLVSQSYPDEKVIDKVRERRGVLFSSRYDMFETCGRIYKLFNNTP